MNKNKKLLIRKVAISDNIKLRNSSIAYYIYSKNRQNGNRVKLDSYLSNFVNSQTTVKTNPGDDISIYQLYRLIGYRL